VTMDIAIAIASVLVGFLTGQYFAKRSSGELQTVFRCFAEIAEERGLVEWKRDRHGRITTGRVLKGRINATLDDVSPSIKGSSSSK
jgi:hypothetical protein